MSLSEARPIVTEPAGLSAGAALGDSILTNRVAKFDASGARLSSLVTSVGGTSCCVCAARALTTVVSSGGGPAGGRPACTLVGYSDGDNGRRTGGAGRPCGGTGDGTGWAPLRRAAPGGATGAAGVDHDIVDCAAGGAALPGGRPPLPRRGPTSKVSRGPPALPTLMLCPSWMSTTGVR